MTRTIPPDSPNPRGSAVAVKATGRLSLASAFSFACSLCKTVCSLA
jgi:hypothetical protein